MNLGAVQECEGLQEDGRSRVVTETQTATTTQSAHLCFRCDGAARDDSSCASASAYEPLAGAAAGASPATTCLSHRSRDHSRCRSSVREPQLRPTTTLWRCCSCAQRCDVIEAVDGSGGGGHASRKESGGGGDGGGGGGCNEVEATRYSGGGCSESVSFFSGGGGGRGASRKWSVGCLAETGSNEEFDAVSEAGSTISASDCRADAAGITAVQPGRRPCRNSRTRSTMPIKIGRSKRLPVQQRVVGCVADDACQTVPARAGTSV